MAQEEIIEVEDLAKKPHKSDVFVEPKPLTKPSIAKPSNTKIGFNSKASLVNLVKRKPAATVSSTSATATTTTNVSNAANTKTPSEPRPAASSLNALSLLSGYDDGSDSSESD